MSGTTLSVLHMSSPAHLISNEWVFYYTLVKGIKTQPSSGKVSCKSQAEPGLELGLLCAKSTVNHHTPPPLCNLLNIKTKTKTKSL